MLKEHFITFKTTFTIIHIAILGFVIYALSSFSITKCSRSKDKMEYLDSWWTLLSQSLISYLGISRKDLIELLITE